MTGKTTTRGETHGCIVCGKLYELYVVYDEAGRYLDLKVMTSGGAKVEHEERPLVACTRHGDRQIEAAVRRAYGTERDAED